MNKKLFSFNKYVYSQLQSQKDTAKHCNFNVICGESTGTYRFKAGLYGLTDMTAEFQKAVEYTSLGLQNNYCFPDDIIIVSTGSESDHLSYGTKCPKNYAKIIWELILKKAIWKSNGLGTNTPKQLYHLLKITAAILAIPPPSTLKRLTSFLGSIDYLCKFIPNLAQLCHTFRPLLKNLLNFSWPTNTLNLSTL